MGPRADKYREEKLETNFRERLEEIAKTLRGKQVRSTIEAARRYTPLLLV